MFKKTQFRLFAVLIVNLLIIAGGCSDTANDEETAMIITPTTSASAVLQTPTTSQEEQFLKEFEEIAKDNFNLKQDESEIVDLAPTLCFKPLALYYDEADDSNLKVIIYKYNRQDAFFYDYFGSQITDNCVDIVHIINQNEPLNHYQERYVTKNNEEYNEVLGLDLLLLKGADFHGNTIPTGSRYQFYMIDTDSAYIVCYENISDENFRIYDTQNIFDTYYETMKFDSDVDGGYIDRAFTSDKIELLTEGIWENPENHATVSFKIDSSLSEYSNVFDPVAYMAELSFKVTPSNDDQFFYLAFESAPIDQPAPFQARLFNTKEDMQNRTNAVQTIYTDEFDAVLIDYDHDGYFDLNHDWLWSSEKKQFVKATKRMYANYENFFNSKNEFRLYKEKASENDNAENVIESSTQTIQFNTNENPYIVENKLIGETGHDDIEYIHHISIIDSVTKELLDEFYYEAWVRNTTLHFEDINFDGYLDISFQVASSQNNTDGFILWDPKMKQLTKTYVFSRVSIDPDKELIIEWEHGTAYSGGYIFKKWFDDNLITVRSVDYSYNISDNINSPAASIYINELVKPNARFTSRIVSLDGLTDEELEEWLDYCFNGPFSFEK